MALAVSQTLPWNKDALKLAAPARWKSLGPLLRPTVRAETIGMNSVVLVDDAQATSTSVGTSAIVRSENVTEAFFSRNNLLACVVEADNERGSGKSLNTKNGDTAMVTVANDYELNHLLALLGAIEQSERSSFERVSKLINHFLKTSISTLSTFHSQTSDGKALVNHSAEQAKFESATETLKRDLEHVFSSKIASNDTEKTYSIHYSDINGLSQLERHIIAHEVEKFSNSSGLAYHLTSSTINSDDHAPRGWALSVCVISQTALKPQSKPRNSLSEASESVTRSQPPQTSSQMTFSDQDIRNILSCGCNALISAEPIITEYDTIVGDGDCGLTLKAGAEKVLSFTKSQDLSNFPQVLSALVDDLEITMGGTSRALYCIFLSSLSQALQTVSTVPDALEVALNHLLNFTRARKGDRTCLDTLIPFVEVFSESGDSSKALEAARKGTDETKNL